MRKPRAVLLELVDQIGRHLANPLHVAAVARVQDAPRDLIADAPAVGPHLGPLAQHLLGNVEFLEQDRRDAFLFRKLQRRLPTRSRELARHVLGEA